MRHELAITVRTTEVDSLGHVNNAKYLEYMEWARVEWCVEAGMTLEVLQQRGLMPVVVNIQINYRRELRAREQVTVVTQPLRLGQRHFVMRQELYDGEGELAADAEVTMVLMDMGSRRAVPIPPEFTRPFAVS